MDLQPGTRLAAYEIVSLIGAGGMGEVYRARDTTLGRDVALKTLPAAFGADPERVARFRREAQVLASLNHPNIAAIHGFEQLGGTQFFVLELVEGEALDARLASLRAPMPLGDALAIARQIVDALEAAHERGIIHRDLKPANIALTPDGHVKVLDFGLARLEEPADAALPGGAMTHSPTITFAHTGAGVILGTAAYMSPEQAKGRVADKRSDIWGFGCVFYELLTAKRAFDGEDATEVIAAIVRGEPDWSAVPAAVPEQIRLLVTRCLARDRRARISDMGVARFLLTETIALQTPVAPAADRTPWWRSRRVAAGAGLLAGAAAVAAGVWIARSRTPEPRPIPIHFTIAPAGAQGLALQGADRNIDIAPDGSFLVYRGFDQIQPTLLIRAMNDLEAKPLVRAAEVRSPFISPDGRWIAYFSGAELKKVLATGGPSATVCRVEGSPRGATWLPDDTIVFSVADSLGLHRVPAGGGEVMPLAQPPAGASEGYNFPAALPNGRAILFTVTSPSRVDAAAIAVLDLATGAWKTLIRGGSHAQYVGGFIVYVSADDALRAVRFDQDTFTVSGDPIPIVEHVLASSAGAANFAVSRSGWLVYVPSSAGASMAVPRTLAWVDRQGREQPIAAPPRPYGTPRLSPDGTRVVVDIRDQQYDIWMWDLTRQTLTRVTFEPSIDQLPVWTPDGRSVVWSSQRIGGNPNLFRQAADGTGVAENLVASVRPQFPTSIHPDGTRIVLWENGTGTSQDVALLDLSGGNARATQPLIHSTASELGGEISPDGHWLAFQSTESGQPEVYVRPFPNVDAGRWQVSTAGGTRPAWSSTGRDLFYLDASGYLTAVPLQMSATAFNAGPATRVLATKYYAGFSALGLDVRGYDVARDGQRFLVLKDPPASSPATAIVPSMIVVVNWLEEIKARVGR